MKQKTSIAAAEYLSHGIFICLGLILYTYLPYYQKLLQGTAITAIYKLALTYFILGLPYFVFRNIYVWDMYKHEKSKYLELLGYIRNSAVHIFKPDKGKHPMTKLLSVPENIKLTLRTLAVKMFFLPLMVAFFTGRMGALVRLLNSIPENIFSVSPSYNIWIIATLLEFMFCIDIIIFIFGYTVEAKWLGNTIKSVDPTFAGWFLALICYPPLNNYSGRIFDTSGSIRNTYFNSNYIVYIFQIIRLLAYGLYVWASVALWNRSSNLTNRGIIDTGPYRYIRHPAYIGKNLAWWMEKLPYMTSWSHVFSMVIWNMVYIGRAITEEKHLLADRDYRYYKQKVRWFFIPKVI